MGLHKTESGTQKGKVRKEGPVKNRIWGNKYIIPNEIISVEEHEGELVLSPIMGMSLFLSEGKEFMYPQEAAEYVWQIVCSRFPH